MFSPSSSVSDFKVTISSISYVSDTEANVTLSCTGNVIIGVRPVSFTLSTTAKCAISKVSDLSNNPVPYVLSHSVVSSGLSSLNIGTGSASFTCNFKGDISVLPSGSKQAGLAGYLSISDVRAGIAEQRLRERKARYGSEYKDLLASYGIGYNDARLQRPEFISGGSTLLRISEVIQTPRIY